MPRRNTQVFLVVLIIFILATLVVIPVDSGILGRLGIRLGLDLQGGTHIVYQVDLSSVEPGEEASTIAGVVAVLSNRINPMGVTEPVIQKKGNDRIIVELPGRDITDKEKERLSRVAILEFGELAGENETFRWENELGRWKPATAVVNGKEKALTSQYFVQNTFVDRDQYGGIKLRFQWDEEGSQLSKEITTRLSQPTPQPLAIFEGSEPLRATDGRPFAPRVQSVIVDAGEITGLTFDDATMLSQQLNAGRLPVPLTIIDDEIVSPILGSRFVELSVTAGLIGIIMVMVFMIAYYRLSGVLASLALTFYGVLVMTLFKLIPVTLTLAGIGGFVLSFGMAVDANIIIFERIKEELRAGRTLGAAIEAGFNRAWTAIRDSNVTTFIICAILYWLGSSIVTSAPVKGFALTFFIGVAVSMFTAIVVTRTLLRLFVGTSLARRTWLFSPRGGRK